MNRRHYLLLIGLLFLPYALVSRTYLIVRSEISAADLEPFEHVYYQVYPTLIKMAFNLQPIPPKKYHITLTTLEIVLQDTLTAEQKKETAQKVEQALHDATKKVLNEIIHKQESTHTREVIFKYLNVGILENNYIAALFESTPILKNLIHQIEQQFFKNIQPLHRVITRVKAHSLSTYQPHISLARFTDYKPATRIFFTPNIYVPDLYIVNSTIKITLGWNPSQAYAAPYQQPIYRSALAPVPETQVEVLGEEMMRLQLERKKA